MQINSLFKQRERPAMKPIVDPTHPLVKNARRTFIGKKIAPVPNARGNLLQPLPQAPAFGVGQEASSGQVRDGFIVI